MTTGSPPPIDPRPSDGRSPRRGGRARTFLPLLAVVWAVAEIWLLLLLGRVAGGLTVFLVLLGGLLLGMVVLQRAGRRAFRRMSETLQAAQAGRPEPPSTRGGNGLAAIGGILLMVPGLLSDVLGLLCLFPPTASLLRGAAGAFLIGKAGPLGAAYQEVRTVDEQLRMRRPDGKVVRGEVIDPDDGPGGPDGPGAPEGPAPGGPVTGGGAPRG
ncbi:MULTISPECIES: FxsA family membrane protein [unclassified Streptomyces]|uniref:FxsA family membrane protein n=1 Tax=unclassified Streptomyces TaxID=2593676 RepID=UPI000CD54274|nr:MULTISPECIES: FxsA family membrane protein [unclassified Streptomyces]